MQNKNSLPQESNEGANKLIGVAAVIQAFPAGVWYTVLLLVLLFIGIAVWYLRSDIEVIVIIVCSMIGIVITVTFVAHNIRQVSKMFADCHSVSKLSLERQAAREKLEALRLQNERLRVAIGMDRYMPTMMQVGLAQGRNITYSKGSIKIEHHLSNLHSLQGGQDIELLAAPVSSLPMNVSYDAIRHQIPEGHNLVGIGPDGLITKEDKKIGACVWIVGLSGTGKTSTTSLRVEERAACGHKFLGVDPHWFKDDSLTNAIVGYSELFLKPMARTTSEALEVLIEFENEFQARKSGKVAKPFQKVTLIVDEVGALADAQTKEEKAVLELLQHISRVCGQEARNFNMGGIFISQQATNLAWLRKVALLVIVHKLLMESEQILATNNKDKDFLAEMRVWPTGRTYVYGTGLESGEGCITVQQPFFEKEGKGQWVYPDVVEETSEGNEPLPFPVGRKQNKRAEDVDLAEVIRYWNETYEERHKVPTVKEIEARYELTNHQARRLINEFILPEAASE